MRLLFLVESPKAEHKEAEWNAERNASCRWHSHGELQMCRASKPSTSSAFPYSY